MYDEMLIVMFKIWCDQNKIQQGPIISKMQLTMIIM